jgi:hypothetical protein
MTQIVIAIILAFLLQLAVWEGVALGITWLINTLANVNISYVLVGGIIFGFWLAIIVVKALFLYGAYKEGAQ